MFQTRKPIYPQFLLWSIFNLATNQYKKHRDRTFATPQRKGYCCCRIRWFAASAHSQDSPPPSEFSTNTVLHRERIISEPRRSGSDLAIGAAQAILTSLSLLVEEIQNEEKQETRLILVEAWSSIDSLGWVYIGTSISTFQFWAWPDLNCDLKVGL
jgi:hypothetical protein